jgi:hypothetical protein
MRDILSTIHSALIRRNIDHAIRKPVNLGTIALIRYDPGAVGKKQNYTKTKRRAQEHAGYERKARTSCQYLQRSSSASQAQMANERMLSPKVPLSPHYSRSRLIALATSLTRLLLRWRSNRRGWTSIRKLRLCIRRGQGNRLTREISPGGREVENSLYMWSFQ